MADDWSAAIEEAYASAPVDEYIVQTIEILHPAFVDDQSPANPDSIRAALDDRSWDLQMEDGAPLFAGQVKTFDPLAFEITLPEQAEGQMGELNLAVDNVPRTVFQQLQAAAKIRASAMIIYREWVAIRDGETGEFSVAGPPDMIIDKLTVKIITATRLRLEGTATFVDLLNKSFPRRVFDQDNAPGLFNGA